MRFVKDWLPDRSGFDCAAPAQKDERISAFIAGVESSAPRLTLKQIGIQNGKKMGMTATETAPTIRFMGTPIFRKSVKR